MKRLLAFILFMALSSVRLEAQEDTFRLRVLAYQWTTTHNTLTFNHPGYANTSCDGTSTVNGYTYGNNISATGTSSSSCSTTYTPPRSQQIDIQKPVVFILADTENTRMILTCTRNVRWSQCHALNPGLFVARNDKGHFEVQGLSPKGKEEWVRFDVVQQNAIVAQGPQPSTGVQSPTSNSPVGAQQCPAGKHWVATSYGGYCGAEETSSVPTAITLEPPVPPVAGENMGFPSKWKSMTSGSIRMLRFETNYIYGEVLLPEEAAKAGAFTLMELKKDGDKYVGKLNSKVVRTDGGASCTFQIPIELTLVTPERIEGHDQQYPSNAKLDWATCTSTIPPERADFTWIPVK